MRHLLWLGIIFALSIAWEIHSNSIPSHITKWEADTKEMVIVYDQYYEPYLVERPTPLEVKWDSLPKGGETR
jgi:hypothetical protein